MIFLKAAEKGGIDSIDDRPQERQWGMVLSPVLPLSSCVTLRKLLNFSVSRFLQLQNENQSIHPTELL